MRNQRGFTLIELLVVSAIVVILFTSVIYSVSQSSERRYVSESERLMIWINLVFEHAMLEGAVYGIMSDFDAETRESTALTPVIYYRNQWLKTEIPSRFLLDHKGYISFGKDNEELVGRLIADEVLLEDVQSISLEESDTEKESSPFILLFPDGYLEPQEMMTLSFLETDTKFTFRWNAEESNIQKTRIVD